MKTETPKDVAFYMALPYTRSLRRDQDGDVVARIEELPGCSAHGETDAEALENLTEAQRLWLEDCIESGDPVPEPHKDEPLPSGKWVQRVPRSLHRQLVELAKRENVSLNQFVTSVLARAANPVATEARITAQARPNLEQMFEQMVVKYLAMQQRPTIAAHWWHGSILLGGTPIQADLWSMDRTPIDPAKIVTVDNLIPKTLTVAYGDEAKKNISRKR